MNEDGSWKPLTVDRIDDLKNITLDAATVKAMTDFGLDVPPELLDGTGWKTIEVKTIPPITVDGLNANKKIEVEKFDNVISLSNEDRELLSRLEPRTTESPNNTVEIGPITGTIPPGGDPHSVSGSGGFGVTDPNLLKPLEQRQQEAREEFADLIESYTATNNVPFPPAE
jgi:hypothetical protein